MKKATVFAHVIHEGPGTFRQSFPENGVEFSIVDTFMDEFDGFDPLEPDLLVVMGGPMSVYQADTYPFLSKEISILERRIAADRPVLGVCLGAQLIARALGARVYKGEAGPEIGWNPVTVLNAGQTTPARHLDGAVTSMFHFHSDTFDLPQGAELLASSDRYPHQIFRYGNNVWALQCHPEVHRRNITAWAGSASDYFAADHGERIARYREETARYLPVLQRQSGLFVRDLLRETGVAGEEAPRDA